jgi:hypothetical protein
MHSLPSPTAKAFLLTAGLSLLTACAPESGPGQFYREAGSQVDSGDFGNATLHNQLAQTCRRSGAGKLGPVAGDPLVVLDPQSTPARRVYRVHCDGRLDGKYAVVIYREYVESGQQQIDVTRADSE